MTKPIFHQDISFIANDLDEDIYVIHISRDPFEVISSIDRRIKNSKKNKDYWKSILDIKSAINEWIFAWNSRKKLSSNERIKFLDINYNSFIKNPKLGIEIISKFIDVKNEFDLSIVNDYELTHTLSKKNIIKIAPQIEQIMNDWDKFGITLDKNYDKINLLNESIFLSFRKYIVQKIKYFKDKY